AADRRRVDTMLLKAQAAAVPSMDRGQMLAAVSVLTGRPLAPLAELAAAGEAERRRAVLAVNAAEIAAAEAAVRDQEARIAALIAEAEELDSSAPSRAAALEATALPAADVRLNRLNRDLDARREMGGQLAGLAVEPAAPAGDATLVANEREAQLGLDLGGPLAAAIALGVADANAPGAQAALKALML